jgi:hypothetical protein
MRSNTGVETFSLPGFDVEHLVGFGRSGEVWRARERDTGDLVALKRLRVGGVAADDEAHRQLRRAAALLATVRHDHIVRVRATVPTADGVVLVLDYAPGGSLAALLATRGALTAGEVVTVAAPLAAALAEAHGRGFVHGDITAGNVLFDDAGKPLLADLGVARLVGAVDAEKEGGAAADVHDLAHLCRAALSVSSPGREGPVVPPSLIEAVDAAANADFRSRPDAAGFARALYAACSPRPVVLVDAPAGPPVETAEPVAEPPPAEGPPLTPGSDARSPVGHAGRLRGPGRRRVSAMPAPRLAARRLALPLLAAGLLATAVLVGIAWAAHDRPAAASAQPPPALASSDTGWLRVMAALDAARDQAFADGDPDELGGVYVTGSAALAAERQTLVAMADSGERARDLSLTLVSVELESQTPSSARLRVRDTLPPYEIVDAEGDVRRQPGRGERDWLVTLRTATAGGTWRIASIDEG